jgi:hypothetical protein
MFFVLIVDCVSQQLKDVGLFRGWGGDLMRRAVTCLIEKLSLSKLPYHGDSILGKYWEILNTVDEYFSYCQLYFFLHLLLYTLLDLVFFGELNV